MAQKARCYTLIRIAIWLVPVVLGAIHYPDVIHGDNPCNNTRNISKEAIFTYVKPITVENEVCVTTFATNSYTMLTVQFLMYYTDTYQNNEEGNCTVWSVQLYNSRGLPVLGPGSKYCSSKKPKGVFVLGRTATFVREVKTKRYLWLNPVTVNILLTEVNYKNESCIYGYIDCKNNYCIHRDLVCNKYDNCGNNSDELEENNMCQPVYKVVVKVILACIVAVLFVSLIIFLLCRTKIIK
ncbi:unnamed protein product [Candidula unifasciata]|uniref:Uncharacterized protein n=1 Tax=Candidula unifasciata TaxID=100452 RepID=A0A8S3YKV0_9EUPU|nr:unnamed protein product [Candidula unifasciata]